MLRTGSLISTGVSDFERSLRLRDQLVIERLFQAVVLGVHAVAGDARRASGGS